MKRFQSILRVVAVGLVLAGAAVLSGCGDGGGHHRRHMSYGGRGDYPVHSRGYGSSGGGGSHFGGGSGGRHDSGSWARR